VGSPVLLLHGFASSFERNWKEPGWVDILEAEGYQVIGLDLLGHGGSPKPTDPEAYSHLEQQVLEALPPGRPVQAIGFSLGAVTLLRAAVCRPEAFERLILAGVGDSVLAPEPPERAELVARAIEAGVAPEAGHESIGALVRFAAAEGNDPKALAACIRRAQAPLGQAALGALSMPVLVVLGTRDFAGPATRLVSALPAGRLEELPGVDHFATPKDFRFVSAALQFLSPAPS